MSIEGFKCGLIVGRLLRRSGRCEKENKRQEDEEWPNKETAIDGFEHREPPGSRGIIGCKVGRGKCGLLGNPGAAITLRSSGQEGSATWMKSPPHAAAAR